MFESFRKIFSSGDPGEKGELEKKLKAHPNDAQARQRLALILLKERQVKEGLAHLAKAAEVYESTGFDSKAVAVYRQFLKYESDNADACRKLLAVLARQGMSGDARNEFARMAPALRAKLGDEAFVDYCRAVAKILPGSATPELLACEVLLGQKKVLETLASLTASVELALASPGEKEPFAEILGRFVAACGNRTDFSEATGFLWLRLGDAGKGLLHLEKALASLRASADPKAEAAARVVDALREGKDPSGKGVFSFGDAAVCLDAFFPAGEGIDIVVGEGDSAPAPPSEAAPPSSPPPAAPSPSTAPSAPAAAPADTRATMGEEDQSVVRSAFGKLQARVEEEIGESDLEARYNLGIAYKEMGLFDEALQEFAVARKRQDQAFSCSVHVAEIHAAKGDFDRSLAELDGLIAASPPGSMEHYDLRYQKADVLEAAGRDAEAGQIFHALLLENGSYRDVKARAARHRA